MDARQRRSQIALHSAIIELATEQPVSGLTISQITDLAGVNRSTFYAHAATPIELLVAALSAELDVIRATFLANTRTMAPLEDAFYAVGRDLLDHIEHRDVLYLRAFDTSEGAALRTMLAEHSSTTMDDMIGLHVVEVPGSDGRDQLERDFSLAASSAYMAAGNAAVLEVWLRTPRPRNRDAFVRTTVALMPPWWPTSL